MMLHMFEGEHIQKLFCSLGLGMLEKLVRSSLLHNLSLIDEDDSVRYRPGKLHLMGDDEHGLALSGQIQHNIQYLSDHFRIQRCRYFVE